MKSTEWNQLNRSRDLFRGAHLDMVLASIEAGNTAARLWEIPVQDAPPLLLLWDKGNNVFYLAGDCHDPMPLADIVMTELRPQTLAEGRARFKVRTLSPSLEENLPSIFPDITLHAAPTLFYMDDVSRSVSVNAPTLPDVMLLPITVDILAVPGGEYVLEEIRQMWPSEERFFEHGFGIVAMLHDEIICWCTAEYVSPAFLGIGIETSPHHERRGVATATAAHFVAESRKRGVISCWECAGSNHASVRVAEKIGFVREAEEMYWIGSCAE